MSGKGYIMRKLNREKTAYTEERKRELEAKGYACIGVLKAEKKDGEEAAEKEAGKTGKKGGSREMKQDPAKEGNGNGD